MKILLTGAFGNVGNSTLKQLLKKSHEIRCFELKTSKNEKIQNKLLNKGTFEVFWGDLTNPEDVSKALKDIEVIIHLAAIIPPLSEKIPEIAYKVNVGGTKNLLEAAKKLDPKPKFIVASSISIYGPTMHKEPPRTVDEIPNPSDNYSHHKVEVENLVQESGIPWLILRLGAVSLKKIPNRLDPIMFDINLDQRIEFVASKDCGIAFANAVDLKNVENKIFNIAGGKSCQIYQRDLVEGMFGAMGMPMLPDSAFFSPKKDEEWFYTDWVDTTESQELLKFQTVTFEDYIEEIKKQVALRRFGLRMVAPFAKLSLLIMSPYYKFSQGKQIPIDIEDFRFLKSIIEDNQDTIEQLNKKVNSLEQQIKELQSKIK